MMRSYLYDKTVWHDMGSLWSMFKDIASADSRGAVAPSKLLRRYCQENLKWSTTIQMEM